LCWDIAAQSAPVLIAGQAYVRLTLRAEDKMICLFCHTITNDDTINCPFCGKNIEQQYHEKASSIVDNVYDKQPTIACLSTAASILISINGKQKYFGDAYNRDELVKYTISLLKENGDICETDFIRIDNPMRDNIVEARKIVIECISSKNNIISPSSKRAIVNLMGEALDIQTGKDLCIFGKSGMSTILKRLDILLIPNNLKEQYLSVHKYYNATKHSDKVEHISSLEELGSNSGLIIALKYFEYVRQIFVWYYNKKGLLIIPELNAIDFYHYGYAI
jgi:hypothetical protein